MTRLTTSRLQSILDMRIALAVFSAQAQRIGQGGASSLRHDGFPREHLLVARVVYCPAREGSLTYY